MDLSLNRAMFGRRTVVIGGNATAARLAGVNVRRHTVYLHMLAGAATGIAATMPLSRTTAETSTHGQLYKIDAIAAVVVGGTLLISGRGTIGGAVLGVLLFATLTKRLYPEQLVHVRPARGKGCDHRGGGAAPAAVRQP